MFLSVFCQLTRNCKRPVVVATAKRRLASTYTAAVCTEYGKPLEIQQLERPSLESGQARVAMKYAGVNFFDALMCQGKYQERPPLPFVPGHEGSGEVIEIGPNVDFCNVGDRVSVMTKSFAQEAVVDKKSVLPCPKNISLEQIAAFHFSYGTAYLTLKHRANLKKGETVFITAAAGSLGLACLDLAANIFDARVIGAAGGADKCQLVAKQGAIATIDYKQQPDFRSKVMEVTGKRGADVIVDMVGGKVAEDCVKCLAYNGRLMIVGFASGDLPKIPANQLLLRSASAMGVYWGASFLQQEAPLMLQLTHEISQLLADGKLKPHIGQTFSLAKVNKSFDHIMSRQSTGKILLDLNARK